MRVLVITSCTNRKRGTEQPRLSASTLQEGKLGEVVEKWTRRLVLSSPQEKAKNTYCGRGFCEAKRAAEVLNAKLLVVSAGLGLVDAETYIPAYDATVTRGSEASVLTKVAPASGREWWHAISRASPFSLPLRTGDFDLILVGLPKPYLALIQPDLEQLPQAERQKLRIFIRTSPEQFPTSLRAALLPYDQRFDSPNGPLPGTHGDFAQRAMRHFAEFVLGKQLTGTSTAHARRVEGHLSLLDAPLRLNRSKKTNEELVKLMRKNWTKAGRSSASMLRFLRDDLHVACEQKRFQGLFQQVQASQTNGVLS